MRVSLARKATKQQYDEHPPKDDLISLAAAINAWSFICGCYMGIEQTLKLLIQIRSGEKAPEIHNLKKLYSKLAPLEKKVVATCYREYRSLHNFETGNVSLETDVEFFRHIGNGYTRWRYFLYEGDEVPAVHLGLMLEVWRALVALVEWEIWGHEPTTLASELKDYIDNRVIREAESDPEWQAASQDESSGVDLADIRRWLQQNGGTLKAGVDLFGRLARGTRDSLEASPLVSRVLLRAAEKAVCNPDPRYRNDDIRMLHFRIEHDDLPLTWNPAKRVFENCPQQP